MEFPVIDMKGTLLCEIKISDENINDEFIEKTLIEEIGNTFKFWTFSKGSDHIIVELKEKIPAMNYDSMENFFKKYELEAFESIQDHFEKFELSQMNHDFLISMVGSMKYHRLELEKLRKNYYRIEE